MKSKGLFLLACGISLLAGIILSSIYNLEVEEDISENERLLENKINRLVKKYELENGREGHFNYIKLMEDRKEGRLTSSEKAKLLEWKSRKNIDNGILMFFRASKETDYNEAFSNLDNLTLSKLQHLGNDYNVISIDLDEKSDALEQIAKAVDKAAKKGIIKGVVLMAHGNAHTIHLSTKTYISDDDEKDGKIEKCFQSLPKDAAIILVSCKTGRKKDGVAQRIANLAPGKVIFAPPENIEGFPSIRITRYNKIWDCYWDGTFLTKSVRANEFRRLEDSFCEDNVSQCTL